jgi:hypothetical protein
MAAWGSVAAPARGVKALDHGRVGVPLLPTSSGSRRVRRPAASRTSRGTDPGYWGNRIRATTVERDPGYGPEGSGDRRHPAVQSTRREDWLCSLNSLAARARSRLGASLRIVGTRGPGSGVPGSPRIDPHRPPCFAAALTIATIPAGPASGRRSQASTTAGSLGRPVAVSVAIEGRNRPGTDGSKVLNRLDVNPWNCGLWTVPAGRCRKYTR